MLGSTPRPTTVTRSPGPVAVVGEFDGWHLGHRRVVAAAATVARRQRRPLVAVVFDVRARARVLTPATDRLQKMLPHGRGAR